MKWIYSCLSVVVMLALMAWLWFCSGGVYLIFWSGAEGFWFAFALGIGGVFVLGIGICQIVPDVIFSLLGLPFRKLTVGEEERVDAARQSIPKKDFCTEVRRRLFKVYTLKGLSTEPWLVGHRFLILPELLINCPTQGVLAGALLYAYEERKEGKGHKRAILLFLALLYRMTSSGKRALLAFIYKPFKILFAHGKPFSLTRDIIIWTLAGVGILPWMICDGIQGLIRVYAILHEKEDNFFAQEIRNLGVLRESCLKKFLLFRQSHEVWEADFWDVLSESSLRTKS